MARRESLKVGYGKGRTLDIVIDDAPVEVTSYHTGKGSSRDVPLEHRRIIAWDGEGMHLSGKDKPQHYVMFGCSAETEWVLVGRDLKTQELLEYIVAVGERYPSAVHVGYGFRYDANMIIKGLPDKYLREIKETGSASWKLGDVRWRIEWIPGKTFRVTKRWGKGKRDYVSVKIDDMVSFFASPFLNAAESILADELSDEDREVIAHGKAERGGNQWEDLDEVRRYWTAEIRIMQRTAEKFRDVMFAAGLYLRDWYGPGAIATYLIRTRKLRDHLQNTPVIREVHNASKIAYAGGRFELFKVGRIKGPVYGYDINSAYPFALSQAPSLGLNHGEWVYVPNPTEIEEFGVYRISYRHRGNPRPVEFGAMPLFHRDSKGSITFPQVCEGWYWSPEANAVNEIGKRFPGSVVISEGWVWRHDGTRPFAFLQEMFDERIRLGKKNAISMPYKLGPNSMYGKLAQRVGWDKEKNLPPRSHCLPLAGWITSRCRAALLHTMVQIPMKDLIAVETDGIYTTVPPERLGIEFGDDLGQWGIDEYDEMLYLQNGIYHRRTLDGDWLSPKSRGLDVASVSREVVDNYLRNCVPGDFPVLTVQMRERFVGLNAAFIGGNGIHVKEKLGLWVGGSRDIEPGGKGKRAHISSVCAECNMGLNAYESPHRLAIRTRSLGELSTPHHLPWEGESTQVEMEKAREMDSVEGDLILNG